MKKIILILTFCFCTNHATAGEIDRTAITIFGITPGQSSFNDVEKVFGEATQWHTGDASTSETKICYQTDFKGLNVTVIFASNSEMAGPPDYKVTTIRLIAPNEEYNERSKCKVTSGIKREPIAVNKLRLGLTLDETYQILGKEHSQEDNYLVWSKCKKQPMAESDPYYERWSKAEGCFEDEQDGWKGRPYYNFCSSVMIKLKDGRIVFLELSSITSVC